MCISKDTSFACPRCDVSIAAMTVGIWCREYWCAQALERGTYGACAAGIHRMPGMHEARWHSSFQCWLCCWRSGIRGDAFDWQAAGTVAAGATEADLRSECCGSPAYRMVVVRARLEEEVWEGQPMTDFIGMAV